MDSIYLKSGKPSPQRMIKKFLPSFCWQTAFEVAVMLEMADENVSYLSVTVILSRLANMGVIEKRRTAKPLPNTGSGKGQKVTMEYKAIERRRLPILRLRKAESVRRCVN